jgi:hypothetical protein
LVSENGLKVEASGDSEGCSSTEFVFEDCVQVSMVVDLKLDTAVIVESMQESKSGLENSLLPIESEFSAYCLSESGVLLEIEEEFAEFKFILGEGFVLQTNETAGYGFPRETEVILLKILDS